MSKPLNLIGQRFGRLTVTERAENNKFGQTRWKCKCDCGKECISTGNSLKKGTTTSCGCYNKEIIVHNLPNNRKHGESHDRLYKIWFAMRLRCNDPKNSNYPKWGGRGITVCDEWNSSYEAFRDWSLANGYSTSLTIDRIDNEKGYTPDNCRWITKKEQIRNRRNTIKTKLFGVSMTLAEISEKYNVPYPTIYYRYKYQGDRNERLIRPVRKLNRNK